LLFVGKCSLARGKSSSHQAPKRPRERKTRGAAARRRRFPQRALRTKKN
jgi:hypothetical protein